MDKVAHFSSDLREELFSETSLKSGIPVAIVEKDFWVCWILKYLFSESLVHSDVIFKGGTSLSKVFGIIERFSEDSDCPVKAINVERTFWEKATILHKEAHREERKNPPLRYSRHYYDMYKMCATNICKSALGKMELLRTVVEFKSKFYPCNWAMYEKAKPGTFQFIPSEYSIVRLKNDYQNMQEMIFGDYPEFDQIIATLRDLERDINKSS